MKLDITGFGAGGIDPPTPPSEPPSPQPSGRASRFRIPRGLLRRYMRERLDVNVVDDAKPAIRVGVIAAIGFFGIFLLFAMIIPVSGAAIATGEVTTRGDKMLIQPSSSGIVARTLVQEGQLVQAGQPLVQLNGMRSGTQLQQAQARRDGLRALEARLIAERDDAEQLVFPNDLMQRASDPATAEGMHSQAAIFERHRQILLADRNMTDSRLTAAQAQRASTEQQLALLNRELNAFEILQRRGFASHTRVWEMQRSAAGLQAQLAGSTAEAEQAGIQRQRVRDAQLMEIVAQLNDVQSQLAQVNPQLDLSRYLADQDLLRSPVTGRVSGLVRAGPGTVVGGGQTLMEIVPTAGTLIVEARVRPEDIDDVHVGAEASIRLTTVNPHGKTSFAAHVVTLSPTRIEDGHGGGYFRAQVAVDDPAELQEAGVALQPGLPASVHITTESRTLWDYLMSPLSDALSRAFREE
jgi:HlyD family type I secretion membrane fusion protein